MRAVRAAARGVARRRAGTGRSHRAGSAATTTSAARTTGRSAGCGPRSPTPPACAPRGRRRRTPRAPSSPATGRRRSPRRLRSASSMAAVESSRWVPGTSDSPRSGSVRVLRGLRDVPLDGGEHARRARGEVRVDRSAIRAVPSPNRIAAATTTRLPRRARRATPGDPSPAAQVERQARDDGRRQRGEERQPVRTEVGRRRGERVRAC